MKNIVAMQYELIGGKAGEPRISGNARGALVVNDLAFAALETPMGINTAGNAENAGDGGTDWKADKWVKNSWTGTYNLPRELKKQYGARLHQRQGQSHDYVPVHRGRRGKQQAEPRRSTAPVRAGSRP